MQGSEQGFLTVVPAPRPALSRSCPSGGALLGAQPHSVFPRAPGPLEGPRTRSLWREGPPEPCTLPHKHARLSGPGDTLTGVCGPHLCWTPYWLWSEAGRAGVSAWTPWWPEAAAVWPARPQPGAQFCRPLPGPATTPWREVGAPLGAEPAVPGTAQCPRGHLEEGT